LIPLSKQGGTEWAQLLEFLHLCLIFNSSKFPLEKQSGSCGGVKDCGEMRISEDARVDSRRLEDIFLMAFNFP